MKYRLQDIIDIEHFQNLQDRLNEIYSFPSSIIDNDGTILTATAWQDICVAFHRKNAECEKECIKSDQYILSHLDEANPAVSYRCPHGLVDNATPIIIDGIHHGNFFTGQFFLEEPNLDFFREQAKKYGFDENDYLEAVKKVPVLSQEQLDNYLFFIKGLIVIIAESGLKNLREIESREKIEKSERRADTILQTAMDGFLLLDSKGNLIDVNETYCRMSGYGRRELLAMNISDLQAIDTPDDIKNRIKAIISKGEDRFETSHRRKDEDVFDIEVSVKFMSADGGQFVSFARDITERKKAEEALREREETHRALVEALPDIVMRFDRDGRHLFVSENVSEFVDLRAGQFIGKTHRELGFPQDQCRFWEDALQQVFESDKPFETEFSYKGKRGETIFNWRIIPEFDKQGAVQTSLSISRDITAQRHAENNYQMLFREMLDGFAMHEIMCDEDGRPVNYRFLAVNPAFERMTGMSAENLIGRTVFEVMPDVEQYWIETYGNVALTGEPAFFENYSTNLGKYFEVTAFRPTSGQFACIFRDITDRKKAEEKIKKNNYYLEKAQEIGKIGTWELDIAHNILTWTDENYIIFGLPRGTPMNYERFLNCVHPEDREYVNTTWNAALQREPYELEHRIIVDGVVKWVREKADIEFDSERNPVRAIGFTQDITSQKQAEEELFRSEERFRDLAEMLPEAIFETDRELNLVYANQRAFNLFGYSMEDFEQGLNGLNMIADIDRNRAKNNMIRHSKGEDIGGIEYLGKKKDGSTFPILFHANSIVKNGDFVGLRGIIVDISERMEALEQIKQSEEKFRLAFKTSPDAVNINKFDGTYVEINEGFTALTGYTEDDVLGRTSEEIDIWAVPEDREKLTKALREQGICRNLQSNFRCKDGSIKTGIMSSNIIKIEYEPHILSITRDITDRLSLERQINEAQKLESIGRLAGGIAHDFNNLLTVISGNSELAQMAIEMGDDICKEVCEEVKDSIREIQDTAERAKQLTRQLLGFSRRQVVSPKNVNLNEIIKDQTQMLGRLIGENVSIVTNLADDLWDIKIDPSQIDQILVNFSVNARDAIEDIGKITIRTANAAIDESSPAHELDGAAGEYVLLEYSDTGAGIGQDKIDKVFEPFFTTKAKGRGTGLGLSTVYGIVKQNNGVINVHSEPGAGTTFKIYLPRYKGEKTQQEIVTTKTQHEGHETVLIVEDVKAG